MDTNVRLLLFTFAALVLALLAWCEMGMAYPPAWWLYLLMALAFAVALIPFAPGRFQCIRIISLLVLFSILAALHYMPWTSRKPFLRDLDRIRAGMTEAQVRHIMNRYLEGTGWPASPRDNPTNGGTLSIMGSSLQYATTPSLSGELLLRNSLVFRHSTKGAFNADWGIVSLSKGRVVRVEFSPD